MAQRKNSKQDGGRKTKHRVTKHKSHKRRTHKGNRGASWPQFVKKTYLDMKRTDKHATFKAAMKKASELKKKGQYP